MKYAHILLAMAAECWAMEPVKLAAIMAFLQSQAEGIKFSAEEIEARIGGKPASAPAAQQAGAVAILPLRGAIANRMSMMADISGGTSNEALGQMFQQALRDDRVQSIVLDVDSPGGAVSGTEELSAMIHAARGTKPIVAHVNALAASAAYWIASAADEMVITPSGGVGSIGVYGVHDDVSAMLEKAGIKKTIIASSDPKVEGNPYNPLSDEARAEMQRRVNAQNDVFVAAVARNRNVSEAKVRADFGQGRVVEAPAAIRHGMADRTGSLDDVLKRFGLSQYPQGSQGRSFASQREKRALALRTL